NDSIASLLFLATCKSTACVLHFLLPHPLFQLYSPFCSSCCASLLSSGHFTDAALPKRKSTSMIETTRQKGEKAQWPSLESGLVDWSTIDIAGAQVVVRGQGR